MGKATGGQEGVQEREGKARPGPGAARSAGRWGRGRQRRRQGESQHGEHHGQEPCGVCKAGRELGSQGTVQVQFEPKGEMI